MEKTLEIAREISEIISSRDISHVLKQRIEAADSYRVNLDFNKVQFVSRSAAHQLISLQRSLAELEQPILLNFKNTSENVTTMLRAVAANSVVPKTSKLEQILPQKITLSELNNLT